jgi:signal transduction histidine kinase
MQIARRSDGSQIQVADYFVNGPTIGVPVIGGGATKASMTFVRTQGARAFSASDQLFAEAVAAQTALAFELDRARRDREEMMLVGDRERIGRDLHDHVIQRLFAAGIGLQGSLGLIDRPEARDKVSQTVDLLDETIREIRNTIFSLSKPDAGANFLRAQVIEVVHQARVALGFEPSISFDGPVDAGILDHVLPHVLAVVREALSNVARHSGATAARVQVVLTGDLLLVEVTDNGVGIQAHTRASGLMNLDERARLLGGSFLIIPADEGGTRLEWTVSISRP